jgi:TRAP-type mannitol/chloroaromatic compound transport system permease small subunit
VLAPAGLASMVSELGGDPGTFFKAHDRDTALVAALLILAIYVLSVSRRGSAGYDAAVETADDIDKVVTAVGRLAAWLFIPMMVIIFYDVSQRKLLEYDNTFTSSIFYFDSTKLQEMEWHLHATLFLLCLGFAYVKDAHVRIELVRDRLRPRARVWLELLGVVFFLLTYCYVIIEFGWIFAGRSYDIGEISAAQTGLTHRWIIKGMMPLGFTFLFAAGISAALKCVVYLFGPDRLRPRVSEYAGTHHADVPEDVATVGPVTD